MSEVVDDDVLEEILIRFDAKDLKHYKCVCKSWHSLITSPRFVSRHLNLSYDKDRYNNELGHRRITVFHHSSLGDRDVLVGSSNGLVCIFYDVNSKLIVGNPLTREVRQLTYPTTVVPLCWGFGYDSSTDDYKVILGVRKGVNQIRFRILSLKSNVWRDVGEEKYRMFMGRVGILYNGALHWIVEDQRERMLIISYDLCKEEFKEIPQPADYDARYKWFWGRSLGIMKECLCIAGSGDAWLMKKYHVKESWELVEIPHDDKKYDILHLLRFGSPKNDALCYYTGSKYRCFLYSDAPVFVESLVSPHNNVRGVPSFWTKCPSLMPLKESDKVMTEKEDLGEPHLEKHSNEPPVQKDEDAVNDEPCSTPKLIEDGKKGRKKGTSSWVRFVCCSSVNDVK